MNNTPVKKIVHKPGERYLKILCVLAGLIPKGLAPMERRILDSLHRHGGTLTQEVRKEMCKELDNISSDYLNNYILKLRAKHLIIGDSLNQLLQMEIEPDDKPQLITLMFETLSK